ncbi:restriction endonuclease subunit S [Citrobacter sp. CtB7.12]|uniref:restriction endonuclease subunit S n=1 Tax=Citrobacter sp. CtB7.12 TaxID=1696093 RepID=UPI001F1D5A5F|nr:restriction endonuclease subunit S [Citrobacter sp. CtB7.12]
MKKGYVPELRFPEFQNDVGWGIATVGSKAIKVGSGITPKGGDKNYKKSGRPFIRSQNIGWGHLILDDVAFIDDDTHSTFSSTEIKANDVLLNITGASIGRSTVADNSIQGGNVNQHVCIIRTKKSELKPYFLNQYLLSSDGQKQIDSFQAGGNRQGLNFSQIRSFSFLLPSVKEQQKIADCLSSLDNVISLQTQKIDVLQQYKKGLMQKLFPAEEEMVPELRFSGVSDITAWNEANLSSICYMKAGKFISASEVNTQFSEELYPCYGGNGLRGFTKSFSHSGSFSLIGRQGALCGNVTFAEGEFYATEHAVVVTTKKKISNKWLFYCLNYLDLNQYATGQAQPGLSVNFLEKIAVNYPVEEKEQKKIADILSSIDELIAAQTQKLAALKTHKTGLMQQLFPSMDEVNA